MNLIDEIKKRVISKKTQIRSAEALELFIEASHHPWALMAAAAEITQKFKGRKIILCGITNAKSGRCSEDCTFCAQSAHYHTNAPSFSLKTARQIIAESEQAARNGAEFFGIVTSGKRLKTKKEWMEIFKAIQGVLKTGLHPCASLGMIDMAQATALKDAGLFRYHHNLETAGSFFPKVCTTHDYQDDVETIRNAKKAGLSVCAGALIGMGETISHRIELAETLRKLNVDSIPVNILNPIKGTPLSHMKPLLPMEILMTIAIFRFMLPDKDIKLCGGKEKNLRQLLPLGILSGANSLMTGNYLTTTGRTSALDHEMISDLGFEPTRPMAALCQCDHPNRTCSTTLKPRKKT